MSYYANPYNVMDVPNEYPLHFAARKGQLDSVRKLLKERFDPNRQNVYGLTSLHLACQYGYTAIVQLLLTHGADKWKQEPCGPTPFQTAIAKGNLEVIQLLLQGEHIDVRDRGHTALHWATQSIRPLVVAWLLQQKADPNARVAETGKTALHLLSETSTFHVPSSSALAIIKMLAKYGANLSAVDAQGKMAIHSAYNNVEFVKTLISLGVDVNVPDREGKTALYYACGPDADLEMVKWLLEQGAMTETADNQGITPLSYAVRNGEQNVPLVLFQTGTSVTCVDKQGKNPLHALLESRVRDKESKVVFFLEKMFLPGKGNVNTPTKRGWTALHYAVYYNCFAVVKVLLTHGASVNVLTHKGQSPLHLVGLKNYEIDMGQEEEKIRDALDLKITRRTNKLPRLPWEQSNGGTQTEASAITIANQKAVEDEDEDEVTDNDSVVSNHGLPWKVRNRAIHRLLLKRGADCSLPDHHGNLPFFLAASTGWLDATFPLLRMAAKQGIFERKNQQCNSNSCSIMKEIDQASDFSKESAAKKRRII